MTQTRKGELGKADIGSVFFLVTYDAANRLTSVTSGTLTTTFEYDGLGNRTARTVDGTTTRYALDVGGGLPEVIVATTGGASTRYVQVQGQILAEYDAAAWGYILPDHLGSVRQLVDVAGQVTLAQSYDPVGVLNSQHGTPNPQLPFGYTGEQEDGSTGLVFLRARYYDPGVGRFLTEDPKPGVAYLPQSLHIYVYAWNNPILLTDPSGLQPAPPECDDPWQICYTGTSDPQVMHLEEIKPPWRYTHVPVGPIFGPDLELIQPCHNHIRDIWIAVTLKPRPTQINLYVTRKHGGTVGIGVDVGRERECYIWGGEGCRDNVSVEYGDIGPAAGVEVSQDAEGRTGGKGYVQLDLNDWLQAEFSLGSGGIGLEASASGPRFVWAPPFWEGEAAPTGGAAGVEFLAGGDPNIPVPQFKAVTLYDVEHNGGLEAWVSQVTGEPVGQVVAAADSLDLMQISFDRHFKYCYSLDAYWLKNGIFQRLHVHHPVGSDHLRCYSRP